jgi:two-component system NtrC family response regulator
MVRQRQMPVSKPMTENKRNLKILIVDDSPAVSDILCQLCKLLGHDVFLASNGAEGLSLVESENQLDLVFTDYKMPVMDGEEMAGKIKTIFPNLPVVLVSGSVLPSEAELRAAGFDAVVHKPFEIKMIAECIERFSSQVEKSTDR